MSRIRGLAAGMMVGLLAGLLAASLCETARAQEPMVSLRLEVREPAGIPRYAEPVTSGIPFPRGMVRDVKRLRLLDSKGKLVPAQFRAHGLWPGGSARWVLVDFQTDLKPGFMARFKIVQGDMPMPATALKLEETADAITVDTGKISFVVSRKRGTLLESLTVGQRAILVGDKPGGVRLRDSKGKTFLSNLARPELVQVEEKGPLRATIRIEGRFRSKEGQALSSGLVRYSVRIYAYAGKDYLKLCFSLVNDGAFGYPAEPVEWLLFDELALEFPVNLQGECELATQDYKGKLAHDRRWRLYQDHNLKNRRREADNFFYQVKLDGETVSKGKRAKGWLDIKSKDAGLALAVRDFWQNYPKGLAYDRGTLRVGLWPREGYYPRNRQARQAGSYAFAGGRQKSYELLLRCYNPLEPSPGGKELARCVNQPLLALARPSWYADTDVLGLIAPTNFRIDDAEVKQAVSRFEKYQLGLVLLQYSERESTIFTARELRDSGADWYGWMDFGGMYWAEGISSLHYDWPYSELLHYLRTGRRPFFDLGSQMVRHRYDIDQYHSRRAALPFKYLQRSDRGDAHTHGSPPQPAPTTSGQFLPSPGRTWVEGLALYYLLTGDMKAWESCKKVGEGLRSYWFVIRKIHKQPRSVELSEAAWSLDNWLTLYDVTASERYLRWSKILFENCLLYMDEQSGRSGYLARDSQYPGLVGTLVGPLIKYHRHTRDKRCLQLLKRMMDWAASAVSGGDTLAGKYVPLAYPYRWGKGSKGTGSVAVTYDTFFANGFAYLYLQTGERKYLQWARRLFRDSIYYWDLNPPLDLKARSKTGYYSPKYPGSLTKVHGRLARYHQVYLFMERYLATGGGIPVP